MLRTHSRLVYTGASWSHTSCKQERGKCECLYAIRVGLNQRMRRASAFRPPFRPMARYGMKHDLVTPIRAVYMAESMARPMGCVGTMAAAPLRCIGPASAARGVLVGVVHRPTTRYAHIHALCARAHHGRTHGAYKSGANASAYMPSVSASRKASGEPAGAAKGAQHVAYRRVTSFHCNPKLLRRSYIDHCTLYVTIA